MTRNQRIRRVALLCCHCARNVAYYRSGWNQHRFEKSEDFWISSNGNFLDLAVLEWCKLFTDRRGKHHWSKVVPTSVDFLPELHAHLRVDEKAFDDHCQKMKFYRDKFIAHLDEELVMHIPQLTLVVDSAIYLYNFVHTEYGELLPDAPNNLKQFYHERFIHGKAAYGIAT